jgi:hypothetical protein
MFVKNFWSMKRVCVFCGSNPGDSPAFVEAAQHLGRFLAFQGLELVFGGGSVGLMGRTADAVLASGGKVIGVIPDFLDRREIAHSQLTELIVVDSMHTRKRTMAELSDAFIALPGGIGTLEELAEILTWAQLGLHDKPVGILNVNGFFDPLIAFFDQMTSHRFLSADHRRILCVGNSPEDLMAQFVDYVPPKLKIWLDKGGE